VTRLSSAFIGIFDRGDEVGAMDLVQVDVVEPEPFKLA